MIEILKHSFFYCTNCGERVDTIVLVSETRINKKNPRVDINVKAFLCEKCFKRMFSTDNWMRFWRTKVEDHSIIKGRKYSGR